MSLSVCSSSLPANAHVHYTFGYTCLEVGKSLVWVWIWTGNVWKTTGAQNYGMNNKMQIWSNQQVKFAICLSYHGLGEGPLEVWLLSLTMIIWDPPMLLYVSIVIVFLLPSSIPRYGCTTVCSSICMLMDIWVVSRFGLLEIKLLSGLVYNYFYGHMFCFLVNT